MQNTITPWSRRMMSYAAVALAIVMITGQAEGQSPENTVLQPPVVQIAQSEALPLPPQNESPAVGQPSAAEESVSGCAPACVYNPCIKYRGEHRLKRFCCGCKCPTFEKIMMTVEDPARCGCAVEIPICVPTCCQGEPCIKGRCGVAGRGVVWIKWCCGYKVRVLFAGNNPCKGRNVIVSYFRK